MNRYRLTMSGDDEVEAETHYLAFLKFRDRNREGFYGPKQEDVEFIEVVTEAETSSPVE